MNMVLLMLMLSMMKLKIILLSTQQVMILNLKPEDLEQVIFIMNTLLCLRLEMVLMKRLLNIDSVMLLQELMLS